MCFPHYFLSSSLVVLGNANPQPGTSHGAGKLQNFSCLIAAKKFFFQLRCVGGVGKSADLHAPAASGSDGAGRIQNLDTHQGGTALVDTQFARRGPGKIEDTVVYKRSAIRNAQQDGFAGLYVG